MSFPNKKEKWIIKTLCIFVFYICTGCAQFSQTKDTREYSGPIIDMHVHVSFDKKEALSLNKEFPPFPENLVKSRKESGVLYSSAIVIAEKGKIKVTRELNNKMLNFVEKNKGFFPIGSVHPEDGTLAVKEMRRLKKKGVKVIKLHPNTQKFDVASKKLSLIVKESAKLGMVLLFDSYSPFDGGQTGKFLMLAIENPKAKIILAHMGGPKFREFLTFAIMKKYPWYPNNVWFDISWTSDTFSQSPVQDEFVWTLREIGMDRILFGSDLPLIGQKEAITSVKKMGLSASEQRQVFYENSAKLFGLK